MIKLGVQEDPKVLVYTDASYAKNKLDNKVRRKGLGIIVVDCKNGNVFRSRLDCPTWFLRQLEERDTQIFLAQAPRGQAKAGQRSRVESATDLPRTRYVTWAPRPVVDNRIHPHE